MMYFDMGFEENVSSADAFGLTGVSGAIRNINNHISTSINSYVCLAASSESGESLAFEICPTNKRNLDGEYSNLLETCK